MKKWGKIVGERLYSEYFRFLLKLFHCWQSPKKMMIKQQVERFIQQFPVTKRWGRVWGIRVFTFGIGCLFLILVLLIWKSKPKSSVSEWAVVEKGPFTVDLVESGDVEAVSQQLISAPMMWGSKLQVIDLVPEGTLVKKGDFLLQFDVSDLQDDKTLAEDQLSTLKADFEKLKAEQSLIISNQENAIKVDQYSLDQASLQLEMRKYESEARQEEARLQLKQSEIELTRDKKQLESQKIIHASEIIKLETSIREAQDNVRSIQNRIDKLRLLAPMDGMVVYTQIEGERVKNGYDAHPGWPLMSIPDLSKMQMKLYVNEVDRLKIRPGQAAEIILDAYPDTKFYGNVREVARLARIVPNANTLKGFELYVDIHGTDAKLKPGMTAQVRIILEKFENVVYVPVGTVFEIKGQPVVFLKGKEKANAVYLGPRNGSHVIIERGVVPGMKLSWQDPSKTASVLGQVEESKRIEESNRTLRESFTVFRERGILHNYDVGMNEKKDERSKRGPAVNLDNLPPSIRQRLKAEGQRRGTSQDSVSQKQ